MESSNRWGWDLVFRYLMIAIMIMSGMLVACPFLRWITSLGLTAIIPKIQFYLGVASIITSAVFLSVLLVLSRHPHYDYFIISTIGVMAGIMSVW
jgi:hypothetical protein